MSQLIALRSVRMANRGINNGVMIHLARMSEA
jgi:hypothetical protein